jgi:hypothetical protein
MPVSPSRPVLGVPIGERDVVRAALTWNLAVEMTRHGKRVIVLAPGTETQAALWPEAGVGPLGTELVFCPADDLGELALTAANLAIECATAKRRDAGAIFVRVPTSWLTRGDSLSDPIPWWLLLSSPNHRDLSESCDLASAIHAIGSKMQPPRRPTLPAAPIIGITIHGVSTVSEAQQAYEHLSRQCETRLGLELVSYGLLVDDLHVYRAIAAQRPIGLAHPQAPATRALMDVARLLCEDAETLPLG